MQPAALGHPVPGQVESLAGGGRGQGVLVRGGRGEEGGEEMAHDEAVQCVRGRPTADRTAARRTDRRDRWVIARVGAAPWRPPLAKLEPGDEPAPLQVALVAVKRAGDVELGGYRVVSVRGCR